VGGSSRSTAPLEVGAVVSVIVVVVVVVWMVLWGRGEGGGGMRMRKYSKDLSITGGT
jgi:hypothetical protein